MRHDDHYDDDAVIHAPSSFEEHIANMYTRACALESLAVSYEWEGRELAAERCLERAKQLRLDAHSVERAHAMKGGCHA
jgi:hypothetical protein